jgi:TPR repeat protein
MPKFFLFILMGTFCLLSSHDCKAREALLNSEIIALNDGLIAYETGEFSVAFRILDTLAEKEISLAQLFVGRMYSDGYGVPQNCERALYWLKRGANGGNAEAALELGSLNENGRCGAQSELEALAWYQLAAENGSTQAANAVGEIYLGRGDVAPDFKKAVSWFLRGVRDDDAKAYCHLGSLYARGDGVKRDLVEAYKWYDICAAISLPSLYGGPTQTAVATHRLREELLPALVSEAHKRALEFMASRDHPDRVTEQEILWRSNSASNVLMR